MQKILIMEDIETEITVTILSDNLSEQSKNFYRDLIRRLLEDIET